MPRHPMPKKNAAMLKLQGTYRKDRHENRDEALITTILQDTPQVPKTIKTEYAREVWKIQVETLVRTSRVGVEDIPILEIAFRFLDEAEEFRKEMKGLPLSSKRYEYFSNMAKNRAMQYFEIMKRFGCTSQDRLTMLQVAMGAQVNKTLAERLFDDNQ